MTSFTFVNGYGFAPVRSGTSTSGRSLRCPTRAPGRRPNRPQVLRRVPLPRALRQVLLIPKVRRRLSRNSAIPRQRPSRVHRKHLSRHRMPTAARRPPRRHNASSNCLPRAASGARCRHLARPVSGLRLRRAGATHPASLRNLLGLGDQMRNEHRVRRPAIPAPARTPFYEQQ